MSLETTVECLLSEVCNLNKKCLDFEGHCHRQNICLVGTEEGKEGGHPWQFCAATLKEILDLQDTPRLDHGHCSLAPKPRDGERPRPFIMRVHNGDVKDHILRLSSQNKQLYYQGKCMFIFPDFALEVARKQAAFADVKRLLKDVPDVKFRLCSPANLRILFGEEEKSFEASSEAHVKQNILSPP